MIKLYYLFVLVSICFCFSNAKSAFAFYKCYKNGSDDILYTNVVCPSGYSGHLKKTDVSLRENQLIEMDEFSAVEYISQQNPTFKLAWMMTSIDHEERNKLEQLAKDKYGVIIKR